MAAIVTPIQTFFRRVQQESTTKPFVWLIGAGMSASSGIPLAIGVSQRIIIFEYFLTQGGPYPWRKEDEQKDGIVAEASDFEYEIFDLSYSYKDLNEYFEWFFRLEKDKSALSQFLTPAISWLNKIVGFENVRPDSPDCYQKLFHYFFQDQDTSTRFLTILIRKAYGVNLAHLALAGILRDFPKLGSTVFTTNFDDLLLKGLLQLNHSARIFGEYETEVVPGTRPNYPQIVHLHGKHTGYNLKNSKNQVSFIKPKLQDAFKTHISDANLIVLGYSGWDDLVMQTLKEWSNNTELIRGNIYWIPFKTEENILPEVKLFLDNLPDSRVHIIVDKPENKEEGLDADSFMLSFCKFINKKKGGFTPYREEILRNARNQHTFVINQLENYPDFDPNRVMRIISAIKSEFLETKDKDKAHKKLSEVLRILKAEDLPIILRGNALKELAKVQILLHEYNKAFENLEEAVTLFRQPANRTKDLTIHRIEAHLGLGEVCIKLNDFENLRINVQAGLNKYFNKEIEDHTLHCRLLILFCYYRLVKGYPMEKYFPEIEELLGKVEDQEKWRAQFNLIKGIYFLLTIENDKSYNHLISALAYYKEVENRSQIANTYIYLGNYYCATSDFNNARKALQLSLEYFSEIGDQLGIANSYSHLGTVEFSSKNLTGAQENFNLAKVLHQKLNQVYNYANTLVDIGLVYYEEEKFEKVNEIKLELKNLPPGLRSPYVEYNLKSEKFNPKTQAQDEQE